MCSVCQLLLFAFNFVIVFEFLSTSIFINCFGLSSFISYRYASITNVAEKFMTKKHKLKYRDNSRSKIGRFASVKKMKLSDEGT